MNAQAGSISGKRVADASAVGVIAAIFLPWIQIAGFASLVLPSVTGIDLITGISIISSQNAFRMFEVILTPLAGIVCLLILIYSEVNPAGYNLDRKSLAVVRIVAAICGTIGPFRVMYEMTRYSVGDQFMVSLSAGSVGPGVYAALITLLVVGVEAVIDLMRPTSA